MKCLINCPYNSNAWVNKYFPKVHPILLKVVNKPLIEYYIDFCVLNKIKDIRIVADKGLRYIEKHLETGSKWGVTISYSVSRPEDKLKSTILKNKSFIAGDGILIINGLVFIDYNIEETLNIDANPETKIIPEIDKERLLFFNSNEQFNNNFFHKNNVKVFGISSITDYFDISMHIIENGRTHFVQPGYNNEKDIFIGTNVSFSKNCKHENNVITGNNVVINNEVFLGSRTIIGNNVIVDKSTHISNSIILDNTYLGPNLLFENKIISQNLIIDPYNGEKFLLTDAFLASSVKSKRDNEYLLKLYHKLISIILIVLMILPFMLISTFTYLNNSLKKKRKKYIVSMKKDVCVLSTYEPRYPSFLNSIFFKLSLNKFVLLFEVLKGNLYLCGNSILEEKSYNIRLLKEYQNYHPAAFTYNEYLNNQELMTEILSDLYYSNNISIWQDTKILIKSLAMNIFVK